MNKKIRRVLCLSLATLSIASFSIGESLRMNAENLTEGTRSVSLGYTDVTGQMDASSIVQENFNSSVLKSEDVEPTYETRTVIVSLSESCLMDKAGDENVTDYLATWSGGRMADKIASQQQSFLTALKKKGITYTLKNTYDTIDNAVAIEVNTKHVSTIKAMDGVKSAVISRTYAEPQTIETSSDTPAEIAASSDSNAVINKTSVYKTGVYDSSSFLDEYDGSGMVVAILDTGLDYTHNAFQTLPDADTLGINKSYLSDIVSEGNLRAQERSVLNGKSVTANDFYVSDKIPFAYDYADNDADVYPSYSNHGTHVAGIVAGYDPTGYTNKDGEHVDEDFIGVAPNAQLVICKVFTDDLYSKELGGAVSEDILAALEDCITLGVDVINMSLGTSGGFTTTDDGDDEGEYLNRVYNRIQEAGISLIAAASNDYSSAYGGTFGTNLASNPDSGTVGSPSTYSSALSVASISGQQSPYFLANGSTPIFYEESVDENANPFDFADGLLGEGVQTGEFEYVVVPGVGQTTDYTTSLVNLFKEKPRIALIERGTNTFEEKVKIAMNMGAAGVIVYNNTAGKIKMNLGEINNPVPTVSITLKAGQAMVNAATNKVGTIKLDRSLLAGPFMSDFSSWGTTSDLKLKPEITAHGGEITSTVPGGYDEQSGTSMASPNMAGLTALVRSYVEKELGYTNSQEITRLTNQLIMSTATTVYDADNYPYSPRKQGAGLASLENIIRKTSAYLYTDSAENDYRPKIELGDDKEKTGEYTMSFNVKNFGQSVLTFTPQALFMTETLSVDGLAVAEQAYMLEDIAPTWKINGNALTGKTFSVGGGETVQVTVTLKLSQAEKDYIDKNFENGMYVEGFLKLLSSDGSQCDLTLPFLGFYGDWSAAPMLDYTAFEIAEFEQDASIDEDEKPQASVYATQAFASYYNETYIIPMGSYVYLLSDEDQDSNPMYANEDYCAVSRYNYYYGEGDESNYLTTTRIQAVYAGLLRNARKVNYRLYNAETGELIYSDSINRVSKAYTAGGASSIPGNVKLEMYPDEMGLLENGKYKMEFDFYGDYGEIDESVPCPEENTYSFSFYVDYQAPVLENANIRYYSYKEGNKTKQRVYLDLEIFDNHYAQSVMLCYTTTNDDGELVLQLATEYITPVRNAVKNGTSKVSIEITDLYEKYKDGLYIQLDDYALNNCIYRLNMTDVQSDVLPDTFEVTNGTELELDIYETHQVALSYEGNADPSNFTWSTNDPTVANVKNGEIVGLSEGTATVTVSNTKGERVRIRVKVTSNKKKLSVPSISFGLIETSTYAMVKAEGVVDVNPGKEFTLEIQTDPWYYPKDSISLEWTSTKPSVATVDQDGVVRTLQEGTASIMATIKNEDGSLSSYSTSVSLKVVDEFTVSSYTLTDYNGWGGHVVIPTDKNIMTIGEGAFEDNDNIVSIVIPETVTQIDERAFLNCTALKAVYFVSTEKQPIADANLSLINNEAFSGCTALELVDFSNTKTITLGNYCFLGCTSLQEVRAMTNVGTMNTCAFSGCTSLTSVDLTGLHMSGSYVFQNCTKLKEVKTARFTAIGDHMFSGCTSLSEIVLNTPKIGASAFSGGYSGSACTALKKVTFAADSEMEIGENAFRDCSNLQELVFSAAVRSIGTGAFANTGLTSFTFPNGLQTLGGDILSGTKVTEITLSKDVDLSALTLTGIPFSGLRVKVAADATDVYSEANGVLYNADKTKLLLVVDATEVTVPASVTEIAAYAFANASVTSLVLPATVEKIGEGAFKNSALASIQINGNLTEIPVDAFNGTKLVSITLPSSVENIGSRAFANTPLTAFSFEGNGQVTMGDGVFSGCGSLKEIELYDGIYSMGDNVFANCTSLVKVEMPSVRTLGEGTFDGAVNLQVVNFGENATTIGELTFANPQISSMSGVYYSEYKGLSQLTTVTFGDALKEIGYGVFYKATALADIDLKNVETVGEYAFANCTSLKTVKSLQNVKSIGAYAFFDCTALTALDLSATETVGDSAFYIENGETAYASIKLGNVKEIGKLAFYGGAETKVELPKTVEKIGYGAFAASENLTNFTVAAGNNVFFAEDGVLYRALSDSTYELTAYPSAKITEKTDGVRTYEIKEKTVYVLSYAFAGLVDNAVEEVVFPYSMKVIGDSAFYQSGIKEYTFESIQAPTLENIYRSDILTKVESESASDYYRPNGIKGYYYANFEEYLYKYEFGGETSKLVLNYPENGVGYDNYVYSAYFKTKNTIGILIEDYTRTCKEMIDGFDVETVKSWLSLEVNDANTALVSEFSETVKLARLYYNNIKSAEQLAFLENYDEKLTEIETELRAVKARFGIQVKVSKLTYEAGSYKTDYVEGETFVMDGLKVTIVYDDNSSELADNSLLTLVTTEPLTEYDRFVEISGYGKTLRLAVTVTANGGGSSDSSGSSEENNGGCKSTVGGGLFAVLALGTAIVIYKKRKETR